VATIGSSGQATTLAVGTTTIRATVTTPAGPVTGESTLIVQPAPALVVTPLTTSLTVGQSALFTIGTAVAPTSALTVTLALSGSGTALLNPVSVVISAGQTTSPTPVQVNATGIGSVILTATAPVRQPASSTLTITAGLPAITNVSPATGVIGTVVTLTGSSFNTVASNNQVRFGGIVATVLAVNTTGTSLTTAVPSGAITGPVTVTTPLGTATSPLPFTLLNSAPVITPLGNRTLSLGSTLAFTVVGIDPNGQSVTYGIQQAPPAQPLPLPAHMAFNAQTGVFSFTPDATQVGTFNVVFSASDGSLSSSESVAITVTGALPGAPTSLSGRVDDSSGNPVVGVSVSLRDVPTTTTTNAAGEFTLAFAGHPAGRQLLVVAGVPAGYANLVAPVDLIANTANVLPSAVTTPPLDLATAVTVNPAATTTLTSSTAHVTVVIPAGRAKNADGSLYTGQLTISPVPEYGRPESRPVELRPGLSVTIQPAGIVLDPPVPITFPNTDNMPPGNELDLWSLSPDTGTFFQVGTMRVSADGQRLETIEGGVRKTAWHFALAPNPQPNTNTNQQAGPCAQCAIAASQGDLTEGALTETVTIPGVRTLGVSRDLTLRYTSTTADVQPILPVNAFLSVRAAVPPTFSARLSVGGVQQGPEVYWDSHAVAENDNSTSRLGLSFNASALSTGHYPYELTLFSNYPQSSIGGVGTSRVLVRNEQQSPIGAGWTLSGLDRLIPQSNGSLVLAKGTGETALLALLAPMNPVSWWPGDGTAQDVAGGNNGALLGTATFSAGQIGQAFMLDGLSGVVQVPQSPTLDPGTGSFTLDAWVQTSKTTGTQTVMSKYECGQTCSSQATSLYFLYVNAGKIAGQLRSSGSSGGASGSSGQFLQGTQFEVADGAFHHLAMVRDMAALEMRLYVDGRLDNSAPLIADASGAIKDDDGEADPLLIGAVFVGGTTTKTNFFAGRIDEVDVFTRALSPNEIQNLYDVGKVGHAKLLPGPPVQWIAPPGDFSQLVRNADNTYTRTMKDGSQQQFNAQGLQTSVRDRNGNQTTYAYDSTGQLITITDPAGLVTTLSYGGGRLAALTDPQGRVTQFAHDGGGNLTGVTYADSRTMTFAYDAQHRLTKKIDARNQATQYEYDFTGRLSQSVLPSGDRQVLTSSQRTAVPNLSAGQGTVATPAPLSTSTTNQAAFTDAKNQTTRFETDALGRILKQTDALNRVTTITRDVNGNPTRITRPNGAVTAMTYDAKGNLLTSTEQAISATTTFTYEPTFNQVTSIRDPKGQLTQIAYDAKGNPLTITDALNQVTTFTYNPQGLLLTTKDALNQLTVFTYDAMGRLLTTTDPLNRTTTLTYDAAGNVATSTDALNRVTTFAYDAKNRLTQVTDPNAGITRYAYDGNGNLLTVTDAKNQVTTFAYDSRNRLLSTTDPLGKVETYTYDGNDNLTARHTPKGDDIFFAYDAVNQLLSKTLPGSQVTSYLYDQVGNLTRVTDPDSVLAMSYDQANRLTSVKTDGSPNQPAVTLSYAYDQNGNRAGLTDPDQTLLSQYDALNRLTQLGLPGQAVCPTTPTGLVSRWLADGTALDAVGSNAGTLRNGATFGAGILNQAFHFDGVDDFLEVPDAGSLNPAALTMSFWLKLDTLTSTSVSEQGLQWVFFKKNSRTTYFNDYGLAKVFRGGRHYLVFGVNSASGQAVFVDAQSTVSAGIWYHVMATVDAQELKLYINGTLEGTATVGFALDHSTSPLIFGATNQVTYDGKLAGSLDDIQFFNRVLTPTEGEQTRCQQGVTYAYDALSRRTAMTLPNGIRTTYQYDPASQVTNILHQLTATSMPINKADYVYNPVGNRTSLTDRRGNQAFGYDQLDRLTSASHPLLLDPQAFAYDAVGNRTTGGTVVNQGNQLTADANFAYQYDDNGNLTRKTLLATGNYSQYTYDAENRLTQVQEFAAGNPTAITTSSYRYDGFGRRIEKVANGQTKRYVYDGEDILLEYNGSNVLQARYTHGPGIDEPLSRTPVTPGVGSGHQAVLASTPDGLRGPVVDDGIKVNGQVSVGFVLASGVSTPAVGQPIDSTGSHQPVAPIDVTAASATGTLAVDLVDTGGIGGNAPVFLVTRDQATGQVIESRLLFPARATFASTTPLGTPLVVASTTVGVTTPIANGTLFYHQDGLGTVTDLTDSAGVTAKSYSYDAYGNILESPGTVEQPYTYTGRELDSETGLYYYRARYYDVGTGRFLQKDPIGFGGGDINIYRYVKASPLNFRDPRGRKEYPNDFVGPLDRSGYYTSQMTQTLCGRVPPAPPGVSIYDNIQEASNNWNPFWFRDQVQNGGKWDYKQIDPLYEDFGNFNYGASGTAFGFSDTRLLREAGRAQRKAGTSKPNWGDPGWLLDPWGGTPPYGDDPADQFWIKRGINFCVCELQ
jgi:RHS repeat-associated protein